MGEGEAGYFDLRRVWGGVTLYHLLEINKNGGEVMARKKINKQPSIKEIEEMAVKGEDVNKYFSKGKMKSPIKPVQRVNVDFGLSMLDELDLLAEDLNISRQAVIKSIIRKSLDDHYMAKKFREATLFKK